MLFAIIAAWLAYKKAKETNRNAVLWAFIAVAVFIGTQLLVGVGAGIVIGIGIAAGNWAEDTFDKYSVLINLVAIIASFLSTWGLLRFIGTTPKTHTEEYNPPPPPPGDFDRNI